MDNKNESLSIEDAMFIFGYEKKKQFTKFDTARLQAEQDWYEGKNNSNPYPETMSYGLMKRPYDEHWIKLNKNC